MEGARTGLVRRRGLLDWFRHLLHGSARLSWKELVGGSRSAGRWSHLPRALAWGAVGVGAALVVVVGKEEEKGVWMVLVVRGVGNMRVMGFHWIRLRWQRQEKGGMWGCTAAVGLRLPMWRWR